jgi:hypothetical protein
VKRLRRNGRGELAVAKRGVPESESEVKTIRKKLKSNTPAQTNQEKPNEKEEEFEADDGMEEVVEEAQTEEPEIFKVEDNQLRIKKMMVNGKLITKYFINGKEVREDQLNEERKQLLRTKREAKQPTVVNSIFDKVKNWFEANYSSVIRTPKNRRLQE